jgi:predicted dehydrogenase
MALKMADARRMARACDEAGVRLTIGFVRRFDAQWGKLKQTSNPAPSADR